MSAQHGIGGGMASWGRWVRTALLAAAAGVVALALADRAEAAEPSPVPSPLPSLSPLPLPEVELPAADTEPTPPALPEIELPPPPPPPPEITLPELPPGWPWPAPTTPPAEPTEPEPVTDVTPPPPPSSDRTSDPKPTAADGHQAVRVVEHRPEPVVRRPCPRKARPVAVPQSPPVSSVSRTPPPPYGPVGPDASSRPLTVLVKPPREGTETLLAGLVPSGPALPTTCCRCDLSGAAVALVGRTPGPRPPPP